jgi:hypothetical protein
MTKALAVLLAFSLLVAARYALAGDEPEPGLVCEFFNVGQELNDFPDLKDQKAAKTWIDKEVNVDAGDGAWPNTDLSDYFFIRWTGVIRIEKDGKHKFYTESDDGSRLLIDGKQTVDNGGLHAAEEKNGEVELSAGDHDLTLEFFENTGEASCKFSWQAPGGLKEIVPAKALFHRKK